MNRLPALTPPPAGASQPGRDISAAQRAFFQAALGKAPETAPAEPSRAGPSPAARPSALAARPAESTPPAIARPGSIIDIRV